MSKDANLTEFQVYIKFDHSDRDVLESICEHLYLMILDDIDVKVVCKKQFTQELHEDEIYRVGYRQMSLAKAMRKSCWLFENWKKLNRDNKKKEADRKRVAEYNSNRIKALLRKLEGGKL